MSMVDSLDKEQGGEQSDILGSLAMPSDYFALLKPRVMSLVVFTALVGLMLAPGTIHPLIAVLAIVSIAIGAGASGALNMWYDADIDAIMTRTAKRPIPAGIISPSAALTFGLVLTFMSVMMLGVIVNWLSAALLAFTIFFYAIVYSHWLKRSTPQNIVIGGAAGAFPPMIGWVAVTNSISIESVVLFAIIFIWTPPHFWALALFKSDDYKKAGIPMMPIVAGNRSTQNQILAYSLVLAPVGVLPWLMGFAALPYAIVSITLGAVFLFFAFRVWQMPSDDKLMVPAKKLFGFSILYLFVLFATLLAEAIWEKLV
ncbi:MAG: heme o synthase [Rhizobiaceae bacterium]|nr:heme o synthase [Rhizobiaceae bacterium]